MILIRMKFKSILLKWYKDYNEITKICLLQILYKRRCFGWEEKDSEEHFSIILKALRAIP